MYRQYHDGRMKSSFLTSYSAWVTANPQLVTDLENGLKWVSFLASGMSTSKLLTYLSVEIVVVAPPAAPAGVAVQ